MKMEDETNKPILKVGDKVRIKSKEWFDSHDKTVYGSITPPKGQPCYFSPLMSKYCGEICTIKQIRSSPNTVKVNENIYNWGSWMFDIVESAHEYKVGDKVRIKSKEWFDSQPKDKDGDIITPEGYLLYFFRSMQVYCGKVYTIESISTNDHLINFKEDNRIWESWMFDPVEEDKIEVGDLVTNKDKIQYVIAENFSESNYYYALDVEHWNATAINKKENLIIVEKGKYKDLINTKLPIGTIARQLRNRFGIIAKCEDMRKEKHFIREPRIGDTIKSTYFNGIIIGENNDKGAFLILTTPYFYKQWLYKDFITEIDGYGRYLYLIDTNECDLDIRANKLKESLLPENGIQVGDVIKSENEEEYIIISNPKYGSSYVGLNTRNYKYSRIPRTNNIILLEPCKYKNLIDTKVSYLHERAELLRDKLLKSKDLNVSNGTTSNNSSEFDLTKVIYKSRRFK